MTLNTTVDDIKHINDVEHFCWLGTETCGHVEGREDTCGTRLRCRDVRDQQTGKGG